MVAKYNIRVQYSAWIAAATLSAVVLLTGVHLWRVLDAEEEATRQRAMTSARVVAKAVTPGVTHNNPNTVERAVTQSVVDDEVLYLRILDRQERVMFRPPQNREPVGLVVVSVPIQNATNQIGTVELGISRATMTTQLMRTAMWDLGIGLVLLVVFVAGSVFVSAPVRGSLQELRDFVQRVGSGASKGEELDSDLAEVDEVAKQLNQLMRRVEDAQQRLERAQKQLKATQKEMDEYTYVISHDLKEPLRGIEAFSKFLADGYRDKLDDDGRHHVDVIRNSALRMQRLINDLLKFSRMAQQKNPMEPVGLNTMLMHVRVNLQYALDAKKADLRVNKMPMVVCDQTAMTEVFHNLISNAIKYNDKPRPVIEVGCEEKNNPDTGLPEYQLYVRDNGKGIKPEYYEKIFQIFQRLERDEKEEGTGIGLTIVRRVIDWHGGRIWVESEEGKGTTFYFTLPKRETSKTGTIVEQPTAPVKGDATLAPTI